jgi:hypothetical protein
MESSITDQSRKKDDVVDIITGHWLLAAFLTVSVIGLGIAWVVLAFLIEKDK